MRLSGKVALITGGGSGIGRATAVLFALEGALVVISDISEESAGESVELIAAQGGGEATQIAGDVSISGHAKRMVEAAVKTYGKLDVLVNSAGISARNALGPDASPEEVWDRVMDINLKGTYLVSWHAVPAMVQAGGGSIVNLASIMGLVGYPAFMGQGFNPYPPSKGGIVQLTRNMAVSFAKDRIRVNCICPGFVWSNLTEELTRDPEMLAALEQMHPMGRLGRPEEIANAALYLASAESSYVTGTPLAVDGGYTAQ